MVYDEMELTRKLKCLPSRLRPVFAACCAERQLYGYQVFHNKTKRGDPLALGDILNKLWNDLSGEELHRAELQCLLDRCMALIPKEDPVSWCHEQSHAEEAGAAVAYSIRARLTDDSQEAAWAARTAYGSIVYHIENCIWSDPSGWPSEHEVLNHPLVQAELIRQQRDLEELMIGSRGTPDQVLLLIKKLCSWSSAEAESFLGQEHRV